MDPRCQVPFLGDTGGHTQRLDIVTHGTIDKEGLAICTLVGKDITLVPDATDVKENMVTLVIVDLRRDLLHHEATLLKIGILPTKSRLRRRSDEGVPNHDNKFRSRRKLDRAPSLTQTRHQNG